MSKEATTGAVETARPPRPPIAAPPIAATALQTPILARIPDVSPAQPPVATTDESPASFDSAPERLPAKMPDEQTSHRPSAGAARPQLENPDPNEQPSGEKMPFALLHSDKYDNWPVSPKLLAVAGTVAAVLILAIVLRGGPSSSVPDEPKDDGAAPVIDPLAGAGAVVVTGSFHTVGDAFLELGIEPARVAITSATLAAEPGGATALAALLSGAYRPQAGERLGVLVCGGNIDPAMMNRALEPA